MKFTFRVTQDLAGYYEGEITIKAKNEEEARNKLAHMTTNELEDLAEAWTIGEDMEGSGDIFIQELKQKL